MSSLPAFQTLDHFLPHLRKKKKKSFPVWLAATSEWRRCWSCLMRWTSVGKMWLACSSSTQTLTAGWRTSPLWWTGLTKEGWECVGSASVQPSNDEELSGAFPVFQPSLCCLEQWLFKLVTLVLAVFLIWPHFRFFFCSVFIFPGYEEQQREGSQLYCPLKRIFHRTLCSDGHT